MKKLLSLALVFVLFLASCASTGKTKQDSTTNRDGSSFEKAIIITEKTESTGVTAEYKWLSNHYPGYTSGGQSLVYHDKKPYDILNIKTSTGTPIKVYFDISNYFGKM